MSGRRLKDDAALNLAAKRVLRGEDHIWSVIRGFDDRGIEWSVGMVDAETACKGREVASFVRKLTKAGIAGVATFKPDRTVLHRLIKKPAECPRLRADGSAIGPSQQQRMWNAMRTLKQFTVREIAFAACVPEQMVKEAAALNYVEQLDGAGYLALVQPRKGRNGANVWRLKPSMNSGPLAPAVYHVTAIFDRNRHVVIGEPTYEAAA